MLKLEQVCDYTVGKGDFTINDPSSVSLNFFTSPMRDKFKKKTVKLY